MNGHYYIYKGYKWKYPCTDYERFYEAKGLIIKYYTDKQIAELNKQKKAIMELKEQIKKELNNDKRG